MGSEFLVMKSVEMENWECLTSFAVFAFRMQFFEMRSVEAEFKFLLGLLKILYAGKDFFFVYLVEVFFVWFV